MPTSDEIIIREYREGDETQINLLYNQEYDKNRTLEEWQWEFRDGPYGKSIFVVAEYKAKIIGTHALLPVYLSWSGQRVLSSKAEEAVVKKEFRGRNIFKKLTIPDEVKKRLPSQLGQKLLLRAFTLAGFLWFKIRSHKMNPSPRFKVVSITQADERLDAFWEAFCQKGKFYTIARTSSYLDWRIFRNPNATSKFLAAVENGRIQGYVIVGRSKYENVGDITDFCVLDEHFEEVAGLLISHAVEYFRPQGIAFVDAWRVGNTTESKRYLSWLKKFGFLPLPLGSCIVLKVLAEEGSLPAEPSDLDHWFITNLFSEGVG